MDKMELLTRIKKALRFADNDYQDDVLLELIDQVKTDMVGMGVKQEIVDSTLSVGTITKGVWDLDTEHEYTTAFEKQVVRLREKDGV